MAAEKSAMVGEVVPVIPRPASVYRAYHVMVDGEVEDHRMVKHQARKGDWIVGYFKWGMACLPVIEVLSEFEFRKRYYPVDLPPTDPPGPGRVPRHGLGEPARLVEYRARFGRDGEAAPESDPDGP